MHNRRPTTHATILARMVSCVSASPGSRELDRHFYDLAPRAGGHRELKSTLA